jgi:hypothetical protein
MEHAEYSFPIDDTNEYPAEIIFRQIEIAPLTAEKLENFVREIDLSEMNTEGVSTERDSLGSPINNLSNTEEKTLIKTIKRKPLEANGPWSVSLYMPQSIPFNDGVAYQNVELGAIGAGIVNSLNSGKNLAQAAIGAVQQTTSGLIDGLVENVNSSAGSLAALKVASKVNTTAANAVSSATRVSLNPNSRTMFNSVPMRNFAFSFKLIPNNPQEVTRIKSIIKLFRTAMYPEEIGFDQVAIGYKFPDPFEIKMLYRDKDVFTKILPSYLTNVTTTYNNAGQGFYKDGGFTDVEVTLSFTETRPLNREDIKGDY